MSLLVIGAGFAGLSAAYHLSQAGQPVTVLEARDRIGGRAHTRYDFANIPVELGAELIHGAEVSTWEWVHKLGLSTIHWAKTDDSLVRLEDGRMLTMIEARKADPNFDITRRWNLPDIAADTHETWEAYLRRIGFSDTQLRYVQRSFSNAVGDASSRLNAQALLSELAGDIKHPNSDAYIAHDYRIVDGYAAIYNALADGLDIRLNTPVDEVVWDETGVTLRTSTGETHIGDSCVITLSVGVLKHGNIRFLPSLPDEKLHALDGIEMGPVMKMIYRFAEPITPPEIGAIYSSGNPPMWWSPSFTRPGSDTVWTAFFSGDYAREMLMMGEDAALQAGLETLRREIDRPDLEYIDACWVNWPDDPYSLGGYSHVKPGHLAAREKLAKPTPPLYWAGEATASHEDTSTVHGAYDSGKRAAEEVLAALGVDHA